MLCSEIWVDGQHLDEPHPIDLPLLVQSLHVPATKFSPAAVGLVGVLALLRASMSRTMQAWFGGSFDVHKAQVA